MNLSWQIILSLLELHLNQWNAICYTNRKEDMLYKQKRARIEKRKKMDIEAEIKSRVRIEETERSKVRREIEGRKNSASKYITQTIVVMCGPLHNYR